VITRLGAPFGAHWNGYPTPDKLLMLALGGLARVIGLFPAANVGLLLAQVSAALSFYLVARWLLVRWEWALLGGLLFAYSYANFHRGLAHFSLTFIWTVPLGLLAVWLVAGSRRLEWRRPGALVCLAAACALGAHNPYNLYFWLQLMGWGIVLQWCGPRRRPNLQIGLAAVGLALAVFLLMHPEVWVQANEPGGAPLIARNYGGTERFALKPVEMFIPPKYHRWAPLAFLGSRYARWSDWRGEDFLPYLGLFGILGLAGIGIMTARRIVARRALPGQALALGWLIAFSSVGGLTNVLAFFAGLQVFRATNRVSIFVTGIVLFYLVVCLSRLTTAWPRRFSIGMAMLGTVLGLLDQVPRRPSRAQTVEIAQTVESDQALGRAMEAILPAKAMVFQLPVQGFPEVVPPWRLTDYELFRPYLVTQTLRFSYGAAKQRARSRWQRDLEHAPTVELVRRLEESGFAALYLNRKGYEDGAETILRELKALGYEQQIRSLLGQQVVVPLRPAAEPQPPLARVLTYGSGWHPQREENVRWAFGDAVLSYFNPFDHPITVDLQLTLVAPSPRQLSLKQDGQMVGSSMVGPERSVWPLPGLVLMPGFNPLRLEANRAPDRLHAGRYQLRSFGLIKSRLEFHSVSGRLPSQPE